MRRGLDQARAWITTATILLVAGLVIVLTWSDWRASQREQIAKARDWAVTGPACPELTAEAFQAARLKAPRGFIYGGTRFRRFAGHVECDQMAADGGRSLHRYIGCRFTSPGALAVRTMQGEMFFAPGTGVPATVTVDGSVVRCVLASNFRLQR